MKVSRRGLFGFLAGVPFVGAALARAQPQDEPSLNEIIRMTPSELVGARLMTNAERQRAYRERVWATTGRSLWEVSSDAFDRAYAGPPPHDLLDEVEPGE